MIRPTRTEVEALVHADDDLAEFDDMQADPYVDSPPSRRKDSELQRILAILDEIKGRGKP